MPFRTPLVVRFGDLDPAGIVYYPRYGHLCHVAMEEFFERVIGVDYPTLTRTSDVGFPVVHVETDFLRPLRYGDDLEIEVSVTRVGTTSVEWLYRFLHRGVETPAAVCRTVTVCVSMRSFEKAPVPDWLAGKLRAAG
jgi:YbgC/YbaW family acyl-CoA thioester hydrolase